jgi:hypothetical protein
MSNLLIHAVKLPAKNSFSLAGSFNTDYHTEKCRSMKLKMAKIMISAGVIFCLYQSANTKK